MFQRYSLTGLCSALLPFICAFENHGVADESCTKSEVIELRQTYGSPSLKTFESYPNNPFVISRGSGYWLYDTEGNPYIDLMGHNLVVSIGHADDRVNDAVKRQMDLLPHCSTMYYHELPAMLCKALVETMPPHPSGETWVVHLVNSGSDAVDLACQMAASHCQHEKRKFVSLTNAYHGLQGIALFATKMGGVTHDCYFGQPFETIEPTIESFESEVAKGDPISGIIVEPIQGYGGVIPLPPGFMKHAFERVKAQGGITIVDEVQTGFCRTGSHFWGFECHDTIPDIVVCAKGLGNGFPIAAVISRKSIAESFAKKMFFNTYGSNLAVCAAALKVLEILKDDNLMENAKVMGERFAKGLQELAVRYPQLFREQRGKGLLLGLEVIDKATAIDIQKSLLKEGVIIGRGSSAGNVFKIQPPLTIDQKGVDDALRAMDRVAQAKRNEF